MTHVKNLSSIIEHGLLSHHEAHRRRLVKEDISNYSVQNRRAGIVVDGIQLHEYVPLYFSPKNPMLYTLREKQDDIVILGVDPQLLLENNVIFSDGNSASEGTKFYRSVRDLNQLRWDVIRAQYWTEFKDGGRARCAEVLIRPAIVPNKIKKIFCSSKRNAKLIAGTTPIFMIPAPNLYFCP